MPGETVLNGNQEWVVQADLPLTAAIRQSQQTLYHSHPPHPADRQGESSPTWPSHGYGGISGGEHLFTHCRCFGGCGGQRPWLRVTEKSVMDLKCSWIPRFRQYLGLTRSISQLCLPTCGLVFRLPLATKQKTISSSFWLLEPRQLSTLKRNLSLCV